MMDSVEKAKDWLDTDGIEITEHRIKSLSELLEEAWRDRYSSGNENGHEYANG